MLCSGKNGHLAIEFLGEDCKASGSTASSCDQSVPHLENVSATHMESECEDIKIELSEYKLTSARQDEELSGTLYISITASELTYPRIISEPEDFYNLQRTDFNLPQSSKTVLLI